MNLKKQDEAVMNALKLKILDDNGKFQDVPLIFGDFEKLDLSKIQLPAGVLVRTGFTKSSWGGWSFDYILLLNTMYQSDMDQLLEQLCLKLDPSINVLVENKNYGLTLHSGKLETELVTGSKVFRYSFYLTLSG